MKLALAARGSQEAIITLPLSEKYASTVLLSATNNQLTDRAAPPDVVAVVVALPPPAAAAGHYRRRAGVDGAACLRRLPLLAAAAAARVSEVRVRKSGSLPILSRANFSSVRLHDSYLWPSPASEVSPIKKFVYFWSLERPKLYYFVRLNVLKL